MDKLNYDLGKAIALIEKNDKELSAELKKFNIVGELAPKHRNFEMVPGQDVNTKAKTVDTEMLSTDALETIVLVYGRPVLNISYGEAVLEFKDVESEVWRDRLNSAKNNISRAISSVGRIELKNDYTYDWVGTGWLVEKNIVITNRHVAKIFSTRKGGDFVFNKGVGGAEVSASIDLLEEHNRPEELTFNIVKILHIEEEYGPDIAFLEIELPADTTDTHPIVLSKNNPEIKQHIAVIGYPARDSRIPDQQLMTDIFGDVYNKKRLAPGQVIDFNTTELLHDCSTLGGNSGSVVLDLQSGHAVGIHFAGKFLKANYAVPAAVIRQRLDHVKAKKEMKSEFNASVEAETEQ